MLSLDDALRLREGKRLVFTNGVFDILHAGHVRMLSQAKSLGDLLFVGVNTDASVRRLNKGQDRPLNSVDDRSAILEALRSVDGVVAFDEDTPCEVMRSLRPEVHVKGGDYRLEDLPEAKVVGEYGGEVVILPLLEGRSTTAILRKAKGR